MANLFYLGHSQVTKCNPLLWEDLQEAINENQSMYVLCVNGSIVAIMITRGQSSWVWLLLMLR